MATENDRVIKALEKIGSELEDIKINLSSIDETLTAICEKK